MIKLNVSVIMLYCLLYSGGVHCCCQSPESDRSHDIRDWGHARYTHMILCVMVLHHLLWFAFVRCVLILYCLLCSGGPVDNYDTASQTTSDCRCRRYAIVIKYNARILYYCITTKLGLLSKLSTGYVASILAQCTLKFASVLSSFFLTLTSGSLEVKYRF